MNKVLLKLDSIALLKSVSSSYYYVKFVKVYIVKCTPRFYKWEYFYILLTRSFVEILFQNRFITLCIKFLSYLHENYVL